MRNHAPQKTIRAAKPASAAVEYFRGKVEFELGPWALKELLDASPDSVCLVDVRLPDSFAEARIPGARNIPLAELAASSALLPKNKTIVTYCGDITCGLSARAALELAQKGFAVRRLLGGLAEWSRKGFPIQSSFSAEEGGPME